MRVVPECLRSVLAFRGPLGAIGVSSARGKRSYSVGKVKDDPVWQNLVVEQLKPFVFNVELNRPKKMNALDSTLWMEIGECFKYLGANPDCRVVVLTGRGKMFTAGIDLSTLAEVGGAFHGEGDVARKAKVIYQTIKTYQNSFMEIERCPKPVISAIHNACIGAGTSMVSFSDVRYCTKDAWFQVKETEIGLAADVGALQQLPKIVANQSLVRELCFTSKKMFSDEAKSCGFVSRVFEDKEEMVASALDVAEKISSMSPVAVQGTKTCLNFSRDHSVEEGLEHIARWNALMLQSEDLMKGAMAMMAKNPEGADFDKL